MAYKYIYIKSPDFQYIKIVDLMASSKTESVPLAGWTCHGDGKFIDDPHLRISPDQPLACGEITITASGDTASVWASVRAVQQSQDVGVYTPTLTFSMGRLVFKHKTQERYLLVTPGYSYWFVKKSVEDKGSGLFRSCATSMCPADPRVRTTSERGYASWPYIKDIITVKYSVHKY